MKRLMILAVVPVGVLTLVLTLWGQSNAATSDTAAASVDKTTAGVGEPVTFTSTNPCTVACSLTWRRPDIGIARFGGVIVGRGEQITLTFAEPGTYQVVLDLGEECDGTSRLVCHSYASLFVDVTGPPPDPVVVDPVVVDPVVVDPVVVDPVVVDPVVVDPVVVVADPVVVDPAVADPVVADPVVVVADPVVVDPVVVVADPVVVVADPVVVDPVVVVADPVVADPTTPSLVAPGDLNVTTVAGRNRLTWTNSVSSATSLVLERCKGTGCTSFRPIATLTTSTTSFIESRIRRGATSMTYRLAASDSTGTVYSNIEVATVRR